MGSAPTKGMDDKVKDTSAPVILREHKAGDPSNGASYDGLEELAPLENEAADESDISDLENEAAAAEEDEVRVQHILLISNTHSTNSGSACALRKSCCPRKFCRGLFRLLMPMSRGRTTTLPRQVFAQDDTLAFVVKDDNPRSGGTEAEEDTDEVLIQVLRGQRACLFLCSRAQVRVYLCLRG